VKDTLFEQGLKLRRHVLGAEHTDGQMSGADEFTKPMQVLATKAAWGLVWSRPGVPRKLRSILAIAFVLARGKGEELNVHLRGAVRNGVTKAEIREIIMQSAIYCGFPEAMGGFRVAREFFRREGDKMLAARARGPARKRGRKL
jgi:4-carboxymuconolactone decarboxylase